MAHFQHLVVTALAICLGISCAEMHVHLVPDSYDAWSDNNYLNFTYTIDYTVPYMNITHNILKTIPEVEAHIETEVRSKDKPNQFFNSNSTFSICDLLQLKSVHPVTALAFATLKRYGHLPEKCPIEKGTYQITRVWPPEDNIQTDVPKVDIDFELQLYAVDNGNRFLILNNRMKGHSTVKEGAVGRSIFSTMLSG